MRVFQLLILLVGLTVFLAAPTYGGQSPQYFITLPVNVNTADELTLSRALVGVGAKKAAAIVADREANGPFAELADLVRVKGIGKGTLKKNRGRISVE